MAVGGTPGAGRSAGEPAGSRSDVPVSDGWGRVGEGRGGELPGIPPHAEAVLVLARSIPAGQVATYGDLARLVGEGGPRQVGQVMSRYGSDAPWWRVLRASGLPPAGHEERALVHYRAEGTPLVGGLPDGAGMPPADYRVDLRRARWSPQPTGVQAAAGAAGAAGVDGVAGGVGGVGEAGGVGRVGADGLAVGVNGVGADGEADAGGGRTAYRRGGLHHVEVWVGDLVAARASWGWLLGELGWVFGDDWGHGVAWELGPVYLVVESGPDVAAGGHDRRRPGVNHLAFHAGTRDQVDAIVEAAEGHGWELLFADRHPHAGGPDHYAAYLQDGQGFEVELVAT
jgi:alkylated DNA nucleotide flippase Atl1/catechol 2,3-dioxygenase-like lactoylglutathione lyase family enzyme